MKNKACSLSIHLYLLYHLLDLYFYLEIYQLKKNYKQVQIKIHV